MICKCLVNNLPDEITQMGKRWIVARIEDGELWCYGCYKTREKARQVQLEVGGVIVWI